MKKIEYPLHARLSKFQLENGLRHRDFNAYHRFCTKHLRKLRRRLELTHMNKNRRLRTQFEYNHVTIEEITEKGKDPKLYLDLLLLDCERAWARANQLKQEFHENKEENSRLRFHYLNRFRKASDVLSQRLFELMNSNSDKFDDLTLVEGDVYHQYLRGIFLMEKEKYRQAQTSFEKCHQIYSTLSKNEDERLSVREEYMKKVNLIMDYQRLCKLWLEEEEENEGEGERGDETEEVDSEKINTRLRSILEVRRKTARREGTVSKVRFLSREISIEGNDRVRQMFHKSYQLKRELSSLRAEQEKNVMRDGGDQTVPGGLFQASSLKIMLALYDRILSGYRDLQISVREELRNQEKFQNSETMIKHLRCFHTYLEYRVLEDTQERNELLVSQYTNQTSQKKQSVAGVDESRKRNLDSKLSEDLVRVYEIMIQSFSDMKELEGVAECKPLTQFLDLRSGTCHVLKCFYQSRAYFFKNRFREAFGLLKRSEEVWKEYESVFKKQDLKDGDDEEINGLNSKIGRDHQKLNDFLNLNLELEMAKISSFHYLFEDDDALMNKKESREDDLKKKKKKSKKKKSKISKMTLLDDLGSYRESKKRNPFLIHFPPTYHPIGPKPLFFDMAQDHLPEFPELKKKLEEGKKKSGGGWFGGLFGK